MIRAEVKLKNWLGLSPVTDWGKARLAMKHRLSATGFAPKLGNGTIGILIDFEKITKKQPQGTSQMKALFDLLAEISKRAKSNYSLPEHYKIPLRLPSSKTLGMLKLSQTLMDTGKKDNLLRNILINCVDSTEGIAVDLRRLALAIQAEGSPSYFLK